jgi:hypothetical protein
MSGTMRRRPAHQRKAFYRDFAKRNDREARRSKAQREKEMARAERRLAALQSRSVSPGALCAAPVTR